MKEHYLSSGFLMSLLGAWLFIVSGFGLSSFGIAEEKETLIEKQQSAPINDEIRAASRLTINQTCEVNNIYTLADASPIISELQAFINFDSAQCSLFSGENDVWFKVNMPSTGSLRLDVKQVETITDLLNIQIFKEISSGCEYQQVGCYRQIEDIAINNFNPGEEIFIRVVHDADSWAGNFSICAYNEACNCGDSAKIIGFSPTTQWNQSSYDYHFFNDTLNVYKECFNIFEEGFFKNEDILISENCVVNTHIYIQPESSDKWSCTWVLVDACGNIERKKIGILGEFDCALLSCEEAQFVNNSIILLSGDTLQFSSDGVMHVNKKDDFFNPCNIIVEVGTVVKRRRRERNLIPICKDTDANCYAIDILMEANDGGYIVQDYVLGIFDDSAPTFTAPIDQTIDCSADLPKLNTVVTEVFDNCNNIKDTLYSDNLVPPFDFSTGDVKIQRTWTVIDSFGNYTQKLQHITLQAGPACLNPIGENCHDD